MNDRVKAIATRLYESSVNMASSIEDKLEIATDSYRATLEEYTDAVRVLALKNDEIGKLQQRLGKMTAVLQALQEDELRYLYEGGDAIVDAKAKVRKHWMKLTGLTYDELQKIAPMKPGHEI